MEKDLESARADANYLQSQESAGCSALIGRIQECNKLKEENTCLSKEKKQQGLEQAQVRSGLATAEQEIKKARKFISGK